MTLLAPLGRVLSPLGVAGGGAWTPARLTGLKLWLAADQITGLSDGDPVTTWSDLSGNANDAAQGTAAKKPTYKTNIINGLPVVRFDGTDDYLSIADTDGLSFGNGTVDSAFAVVIVFQLTDVATPDMLVSKRNANAEYWIGTQASAGANFSLGDGGVASRIGRLDTGGISATTPYILSCLYSGSGVVGGVSMYRNGAQVDDTNDVAGTYVAMENSTVPVEIGSYAAGASDLLKGDIGEVIICGDLSTDRAQLEAYLAARWGISL